MSQLKNIPITAAVVNYKTPGLTLTAIESLRRSDFPGEIMLIDNDEFPGLWPNWIDPLRIGSNIGHGGGIHVAMRRAKPGWVLLFDSDAEIVHNGLIDHFDDLLASRRMVYGVGAVQRFQHPDIDNRQISYLHPFCSLVNRSAYFKHHRAIDHGAPFVKTMDHIRKSGFQLLKAKRIFEFVKHKNRGTRSVATPSYQKRYATPYIDKVTLLNYLSKVYDLKRYLEIGCFKNDTFDRIGCRDKTGVDPQSGGTHRMTSDEFFFQNNRQYDLIFVDGLHDCGQVVLDAENALKILSPNGVIVFHDTCPRTELQQRPGWRSGSWCGDVWKAIAELRQRTDCDLCTIDSDFGLTVLVPRRNTFILKPPRRELTWADYTKNRTHFLRVTDWSGLLNFLPKCRT